MGQAALDLQSGNLTSVRSEVYFVSRGGDACLVIPRRGVALASSYAGVHRLDIDASWSHVMRRQAAQAGAHSVLEVVTLEGKDVLCIIDLVTGVIRRAPWSCGGSAAGGRTDEEVVRWGSGNIELVDLRSWRRTPVGRGRDPCMSGGGRLAYVDATGRGICVYDTHSGTTRRVRGPGARLGAVAWTPDDRYVAYTYEVGIRGFPTRMIGVWGVGLADVATGDQFAVLPAGPVQAMYSRAGRTPGGDFTIVERMPSPELLSATENEVLQRERERKGTGDAQ